MYLDLLSIGGALVDFVFPVHFDFIAKFKLQKGSPIEDIPLDYVELSKELNLSPYIFSGGSANNVSKVVSGFGLKSGFLGKVGRDSFGRFFESSIKDYKVEPFLHEEITKRTGRTYVFLTPDGDRTMCPYYEANEKVKSKEIRENLDQIDHVELIFLDSYNLIYKKSLTQSLFKKKNYTIALDLSNKEIVRIFKDYILSLIGSRSIQLLFTNEEEICTLTEIDDPILACHSLQDYCEQIILMRGSKGSIAFSRNAFETHPAKEVQCIDKTGAGDVFIGGFIYGYLKKRSLSESLKLGTLAAQHCLNTIGAELPHSFFKNFPLNYAI